jgi:predicted aspartyl protease
LAQYFTILLAAIFSLHAISLKAQHNADSKAPVITILGSGIRNFESEMEMPAESMSGIIPFSRAGNLIIIRAKADTMEGNFVLDTGAPGLILNLTYFRHYPSSHQPEAYETQGGVTGRTAGDAATTVSTLSMGPFEYSKVSAHRIQLGHIENAKGIKILGLLGVQLFARFNMIIDYASNQIHLYRVSRREMKTYRTNALADSAYTTLSFILKDGKMLTTGRIGNKKLSFVIDTGAESNVLDSRLPDEVLDSVVVSRRVSITGAGSRQMEALHGKLYSLQLESGTVNDLPVVVMNLEAMSKAYDRQIDGMLGYDFLSQQRVGINFVQRKMYFWK